MQKWITHVYLAFPLKVTLHRRTFFWVAARKDLRDKTLKPPACYLGAYLLETIYKYRILAFVVAHKVRRRNSCVYAHEKKYHLAKELDISPNTYSKYLSICKDLGYAVASGCGYRFVKLSTVIFSLFGENSKDIWKHTRFFSGVEYKENRYNEILDRILFSVADCNFKRQEFRVESKLEVLKSLQNRTLTYPELRRAKKLAKRYGCEVSQLPSICRADDLHVKTGKFHLSGLLGCAPSTATVLLRKWAKIGRIRRFKVIKEISSVADPFSLPFLVEEGHHQHPFVYNGRVLATVGSKIERISK